MASNAELHALNTGRPPLVAMVTRQLKQMLFRYAGGTSISKPRGAELECRGAVTVLCFRYQGHVGSSLIIGGTDVTGAHLYSVYPHGSYDKLPYLTMGTSSCPSCLLVPWTAQQQHSSNNVCVCVCSSRLRGCSSHLCVGGQIQTKHGGKNISHTHSQMFQLQQAAGCRWRRPLQQWLPDAALRRKLDFSGLVKVKGRRGRAQAADPGARLS